MRSDKYKNKKSEFSFGGSKKSKTSKSTETSIPKNVESDDFDFDFLDLGSEPTRATRSTKTSRDKKPSSEEFIFDRGAFDAEPKKAKAAKTTEVKPAKAKSAETRPVSKKELSNTTVMKRVEAPSKATTKVDSVNDDFIDDFDKVQPASDFVFDRSIFGEVDEEEIKKSERKFQKELKKQDKINKKKNKKRNKGKKSVASGKRSKKGSVAKFFFVLLLTVGVCCAGVFFYMHTKINKMDFIDTTPAEFCIDDSVASSLKGYRNIAILGVDSRKGEGFDGVRSDAIIIASVNKKNNDVKLISVLRDTHLLIGQGAENYSDYYALDKITHAFSYGGPVNTCAALNKALDLNIHEFIVMDWNSVADVVDIFGGLELDIQQNELRDLNKWGPETAVNTDRTWNPIWETGKQKLDGAQVATYCRIRKTSGGDEGRTNRMKKVTIALLKTALENPSKIDKVLDTVLPEVQTNMGTTAFTSLLPRLAGFSITDSIGWPKDYYGGTINGKWLAVPKTLETNVVDLHKNAFEQENYVLSMQAQRINQQIISETGIQALP